MTSDLRNKHHTSDVVNPGSQRVQDQALFHVSDETFPGLLHMLANTNIIIIFNYKCFTNRRFTLKHINYGYIKRRIPSRRADEWVNVRATSPYDVKLSLKTDEQQAG